MCLPSYSILFSFRCIMTPLILHVLHSQLCKHGLCQKGTVISSSWKACWIKGTVLTRVSPFSSSSSLSRLLNGRQTSCKYSRSRGIIESKINAVKSMNRMQVMQHEDHVSVTVYSRVNSSSCLWILWQKSCLLMSLKSAFRECRWNIMTEKGRECQSMCGFRSRRWKDLHCFTAFFVKGMWCKICWRIKCEEHHRCSWVLE